MSPDSSDWKEQAYQAYVKNWEAQEAHESERRQAGCLVAIWLRPGDDDAPVFSREQQAELSAFVEAFRDQKIELEAPTMALDSVDAVGGYTGQFALELGKIAAPIISVALVAWINGKFGRKIVVEFYPDGAPKRLEANNPAQIVELLENIRRTTSSSSETSS